MRASPLPHPPGPASWRRDGAEGFAACRRQAWRSEPGTEPCGGEPARALRSGRGAERRGCSAGPSIGNEDRGRKDPTDRPAGFCPRLLGARGRASASGSDPAARRREPPAVLRRWALALSLALLAALLLLSPAGAQTFPPLTGRVVDAAGLLDPATEADLTRELQAFEAKSSDQVVVATVPDLQGYEIEDYGYRLGRAWGIGQKGENNGVILLVSRGDRRVRIEVGYGLEGTLTDALSRLVIEGDILPRFRANDYAGGIKAGTQAILQILGGDAAEVKARAERNSGWQEGDGGGWLTLGVILFILAVAIGPLVLAFLARLFGGGGRGGPGGGTPLPARRRRRALPVGPVWGGGMGSGWGGSGWGGGGSSSGGFSGGGGSFGGGGASGSW